MPDHSSDIDSMETASEQLRLAMRRMAASVCVVSAVDQSGHPCAMTATSVISVSMEPAALLISVNRGATVHAAIMESNNFCVSILRRDQQKIAEQCSLPELEEDYLTLAPWQRDKKGIPYLPDSQACVFCALDRAIEYSTHSIFIGQVSHASHQGEIDPLLYFDGQYFSQGPAPQ